MDKLTPIVSALTSESAQDRGLPSAAVFVNFGALVAWLGAGRALIVLREERGKEQRFVWGSGKQMSSFHYQHQAATLLSRG